MFGPYYAELLWFGEIQFLLALFTANIAGLQLLIKDVSDSWDIKKASSASGENEGSPSLKSEDGFYTSAWGDR